MSSADFRHIEFQGGGRNSERLFRAAVSAFAALSRPTRRELIQLDDLTLGLFDSVSVEARRYAAAVLSDCNPAPLGLVKRLSDEPVAVSAPLLVRCPALSDVDLIALISRHGLAHARAIARRKTLHPTIAALIRALLARAEATGESEAVHPASPNNPLEAVRRQLRELMQQPAETASTEEPAEIVAGTASERDFVYARLRETALAGKSDGFAAALATALRLPRHRARGAVEGNSYTDLLTALRTLDLTAEQAFFLSATIFPDQLDHPAAARLFFERYAAMSREMAADNVAAWRGSSTGDESHGPDYPAASAK